MLSKELCEDVKEGFFSFGKKYPGVSLLSSQQ